MSQLHPFITNELSKSDMIANYEKQRSELITTHKQVLYPSSVYPLYFHPPWFTNLIYTFPVLQMDRLFEAVQLQKKYYTEKIETHLKEIADLKLLILNMNNLHPLCTESGKKKKQ